MSLACDMGATSISSAQERTRRHHRVFQDGRSRDSSDSVFVGRDHLQQAGSIWNGGHSMQYHTNAIQEGADLMDAVVLAYDASLSCDSCFLSLIGVRPLVMSVMRRTRTVPIAVGTLNWVLFIEFQQNDSWGVLEEQLSAVKALFEKLDYKQVFSQQYSVFSISHRIALVCKSVHLQSSWLNVANTSFTSIVFLRLQ